MTNIVCFKVIYYKAHVSVSVRVSPTRSISSELSGQTWCGGDLHLSCMSGPWQQMFVETKSRRRKTGEEEEREEIYVGVDC